MLMLSPAEIEKDYDPAVELIGSIEEKTLAGLSPLLRRPPIDAASKGSPVSNSSGSRTDESRKRLAYLAFRFIRCGS